MAQIFKSKDLTFSIPENEPDFARATQRIGFTTTITIDYTHIHFTTTIWTFPTYSAFCCTPTPICTLSDTPFRVIPQEISEIEDAKTLGSLKEKLNTAIKEVDTKLNQIKTK